MRTLLTVSVLAALLAASCGDPPPTSPVATRSTYTPPADCVDAPTYAEHPNLAAYVTRNGGGVIGFVCREFDYSVADTLARIADEAVWRYGWPSEPEVLRLLSSKAYALAARGAWTLPRIYAYLPEWLEELKTLAEEAWMFIFRTGDLGDVVNAYRDPHRIEERFDRDFEACERQGYQFFGFGVCHNSPYHAKPQEAWRVRNGLIPRP